MEKARLGRGRGTELRSRGVRLHQFAIESLNSDMLVLRRDPCDTWLCLVMGLLLRSFKQPHRADSNANVRSKGIHDAPALKKSTPWTDVVL
jgi:hypothetical protein